VYYRELAVCGSSKACASGRSHRNSGRKAFGNGCGNHGENHKKLSKPAARKAKSVPRGTLTAIVAMFHVEHCGVPIAGG
jgi:hypothetical protein